MLVGERDYLAYRAEDLGLQSVGEAIEQFFAGEQQNEM
jgi:hypothetical protein